MVDTLNELFAIGTIIMQIAIVVFVVAFVVAKFSKKKNVITEFVEANAILIAFLIALGSTLGSLLYSELVGYDPCKLCWLQRVAIYPQVITLGVALWKKDLNVLYSTIILSVIGSAVALYQYLGQMAILSGTTCVTSEASIDCSQRLVLMYGYITIPLMSLTALVLILVVALAKKFSK